MQTSKFRALAAVTAVAMATAATAAELKPVAMTILKPGAVRPESWLRLQLANQAAGITGNAERLYDDIGRSDWLTGAHRGGQYDWERGPYYAKGLLALAWALDDADLKAKAKRWADAFLGSQRTDGDFGPRRNNWWANMIALHFLRDWAEATDDARVVPFLERYFRFQRTALAKKPLGKDSCWAACRGGDELEVVIWLHEKTKNPEWLAFAEFVRGQTCDWALYYLDGRRDVFPCGGKWNSYQNHIVNLHQGLKTPALAWRMTGEKVQREAWRNATSPEGWMMRQCGRADGLVNGTEPITSKSTTEGVELCAQAERILSGQVALSVFGDGEIGDDLERVAYNTLPATVDPQGRGTRYYCILNQPACLARDHAGWGYRFRCNGDGASMCPGPEAGFGCCRSNFHFAWPKFVQSMWMGLPDGGLAATAYGPCWVAANGFALVERTDYPFRDTIEIEVASAPAEARTLAFRVPKWARGADVAVNGTSANGVVGGRFTRIRRVWKKGDRVTVSVPCSVETSRDAFNGSAYVKRGALVFAWPVPSERRALADRYAVPGFEKYELAPTAPWNVALELPAEGVTAKPELAAVMPANPFDPATPAVTLTVRGFRTQEGEWGTMRDGSGVCAVEPPKSPVARGGNEGETLRLQPLGSTQTRITCFPWTATTR